MTPNARWRLILLAGLLLVRFGYELIDQPAYVVATYVLAYVFFRRTITRQEFPQYNMTRLTLNGTAIAVSVAVVLSLINCSCEILFRGRIPKDIVVLLFGIPFGFLVQFVLNALPEELFFRGILWGECRRIKLSNLSILCIQAILFWGAHYFYYDNPFNWVRVMISGLIFGIVAWRTRSILASSILHAMFNTNGDFFKPMM
ncbi:MAG: CPBP family intramembrane metalloprotease [Holophagales bacterium]|jgi:membrane protease YdiL (CAAX protease family)|nr:CPBP family intramembrane metalloprotease [Holophagales bacterium]